ncbi:Unknown protein, partial [Striga hermonthica]
RNLPLAKHPESVPSPINLAMVESSSSRAGGDKILSMMIENNPQANPVPLLNDREWSLKISPEGETIVKHNN